MKSLTQTRTVARAWDRAALLELKTGVQDIGVVDRASFPQPTEAIQQSPVTDFRARIARTTAAGKVATGLRQLRLIDAELQADIVRIALTFLEDFERRMANLRIEVVDTQACPKFHCDNVYVRLVTTYVGPATEYQFVGESAIQRAKPGSLVFLKGHQHPTHRDSVHHRSPAIPHGARRLCVVLDC